jgi:hypothetical membrane protein
MARPGSTTPSRVISASVTSRRLALLGFASVGVILAGVVATAIPYQGHAAESYSPLNHFVSELGEISGSTLAWAFNAGIVLGGMGLGAFLLLLVDRFDGPFRIALVCVGVVAGISGTLVGVYPMDYHLTHRIVSGILFLTGWLAVAIFSLRLLVIPRPGMPRWLLVPGAAVVAVSWTFIAVYSTYQPANPDGPIANRPPGFWSVPFLEWASLLTLLAWFVCVSIALLRERSE